MIAADWFAMLPLMVLSGGVAILLLVVSFWRRHGLIAWLTVIAFGATLAAIPFALPVLPREVTPLFWFDRYGAFFYALFGAAGLVTTLLSYRYLQRRRGDLEEYYIMLATATIGAMAMASAAHFASLLLGLELLSISLYVLVGYPEEHHAPLEAALKYLLLSGVASTTMLFGMALIYLDTGTLEFAKFAAVLRGGDAASLYLIVGNVLLLAGIAFKLSLVPFHMWTPDVYEGAPAPVSGYLATVSKGAVFALALRYVVDTGALENASLYFVVSAFAVLSMVVGNLLALLQQNVKRILAYSSIAHMGYMLIAVLVVSSAAPTIGVETALVYLAAYFAMTLGAFAIVTVLSRAEAGRDADSMADYEGLFWRRPLLAASFAVMLLSLAGIPMTLGFIGKFYLFSAGVEGARWVLLWALIVGSAIGLFYYLRIIFAMTRQHDESVGEIAPRGSLADRSAIVALTLVLLAFGIYPMPLIEFARTAMASFGAATAAARVATDTLGGGL
jgi:NADH-quinone oxidoreductase subunit N